MGQQRNRKVWLAITALSGALAACEGENVLVGTARESLYLNVCMGANTVCEAEPSAEPLAMPAARPCNAEPALELEPDLEVDLARICTDMELCQVKASNLAVAPDGTSWVLGAFQGGTDAGELWLVRISPEGDVLDSTDPLHGMQAPPENSVLQRTALAVDERGHAFVMIYEMDAGPNADAPLVERSWLTEYGADGLVANGPRLLTGTGAPHLAIAGDDRLVIAANGMRNARHGVLAALDAQGALWSQNGVPTNGQGAGYGVVGVAAGGSGSFVLAERGRSGDTVTYGLTRFDAHGNALWGRSLAPLYMNATVVAAGDGHALIGASMPPSFASWLGKIDEDGDVEWVYDVNIGWAHYFGGTGMVVDLERDTALVVVAGGLAASGNTGLTPELVELSLDGESCTRYSLPRELNTVSHVAVDHAGGAYVMDSYMLARVRLPAERASPS